MLKRIVCQRDLPPGSRTAQPTAAELAASANPTPLLVKRDTTWAEAGQPRERERPYDLAVLRTPGFRPGVQ